MRKHLAVCLFQMMAATGICQYTWDEIAHSPPSAHFDNLTLMDDGTLFGTAWNDTSRFLMTSSDNGENWQKVNAPYPQDNFPQTVFGHGNKLFLGGTTLSVSTNGGQNWNSININNPINIRCGPMMRMSNGDVYMLTNDMSMTVYNRFLYKSIDGGSSWTKVNMNGIGSDINHIKAATQSNGVLIMTVYDGPIQKIAPYFSVDSGKTWTMASINIFGSGFYRNTGFANGPKGEVLLIGSGYGEFGPSLYISVDDGKSWEPEPQTGLEKLYTTGAFIKSKESYLVTGTAPDTTCKIYKTIDAVNVPEERPREEMTVWPNPASDRLYFCCSRMSSFDWIDILDSRGNTLRHRHQTDYIIVSSLDEGFYLLRATTDKGTVLVKRFIVSR